MTSSSDKPDIGVLDNLPEEVSFLAVPAIRFFGRKASEISPNEKRELEGIGKRMREGNFFQTLEPFWEEYRMVDHEESIRLFELFALLKELEIVYENYLLSFVTDDSGSMVSIHMDLNGADRLIGVLEFIRKELKDNICEHDHLFGTETNGEDGLTLTKLAEQESEKKSVFHVNVYGWNDEWAVKHKLRPH